MKVELGALGAAEGVSVPVHYGSLGVGPQSADYRWMVSADPDGLESIVLKYEEYVDGKWKEGSSIQIDSLATMKLLLEAAEIIMAWDKRSGS